MGNKRRNYGDHWVVWDAANNEVVVSPRYPNGTTTIEFGIGDARIRINTSNPPPQIIVPITGETTADSILPTDPFKLRRWHAYPSSMSVQHKTITGFNGWSKTIEYHEASDVMIKEAGSNSDVLANGFGVFDIAPQNRLNW